MKKSNSKYLKDYEADLITALYHNYTRLLPTSVLREMERIYEEEKGTTLITNYGCSACILKLVKQCARMYFKDDPERIPEDLRDRQI